MLHIIQNIKQLVHRAIHLKMLCCLKISKLKTGCVMSLYYILQNPLVCLSANKRHHKLKIGKKLSPSLAGNLCQRLYHRPAIKFLPVLKTPCLATCLREQNTRKCEKKKNCNANRIICIASPIVLQK